MSFGLSYIMRSITKITFISLFSLFFIGLFTLPTNATITLRETISTGSDGTTGTCYNRNNWQTFNPQSLFDLAYIDVYVDDVIYADYLQATVCNDNSFPCTDIQAYSTAWFEATSTDQWLRIDFTGLGYWLASSTYYLQLTQASTTPACASTNFSLYYDSSNPYSRGEHWFNSGWDMSVRIYGDDYSSVSVYEPADWFGEVEIESEEWLSINDEQYCIIGSACFVWFNYNSEMVDKEVYLIQSTASEPLTYRTLDDILIKEDYWNLTTEDPGVPERQLWYMVDPENERGTGFYLNWTDESILQFCDDWDCDCTDVATGTDWFNFQYGIECGARRLMCWGVCPDDDTILKFAKTVDRANTIFPYSVYNKIKTKFDNYSLASSTEQFTFNFYDFGITDNSSFDEDLVLASSTIMETTFGTFWNRIYWIMEVLLYLGLILYIIKRLMELNRKAHELKA